MWGRGSVDIIFKIVKNAEKYYCFSKITIIFIISSSKSSKHILS